MTTPGALIAGRYRLTVRVATGGMGSVWEAWDELLQRRVAVKQLLPQPGMSPGDAATARHRVIREARITARLHHPHAVTLYDVVEHGGEPCLIMQYVPSRSLNALLQEHGVLSPPVVARIGAEVASALAAAHLVGIVHRDVKPSNVLITPDGSAKLTDFGISHAAGDVSLTSTGMVSGTPAYLAPEVARGAASGFPADVFSLGATLYAALEGAPPFGTDLNPMAILHRVASGQVIAPKRSGVLTPMLLRMLAPDAADRPDMERVARELAATAAPPPVAELAHSRTTALPPATVREWPADLPVQPTSVSAPRPQSNWSEGALARPAPFAAENGPVSGRTVSPRRRRTRIVGAAMMVALLGLLGVVLFYRQDRTATAGSPGGVAATTGRPSAASTSPTRSSPAAPAVPRSTAGSGNEKGTPTRPSPTAAPRARTTSTSARATPGRVVSPVSTGGQDRGRSTSRAPSSSTAVTAPALAPTAAPPTAAQLVGALTAYYAALPGGTSQGWELLTPNFQANIAINRYSYQAFWDGMAAVQVSDVQGEPPDTVRATVTYHRKDGEVVVESTRFRLVRSAGILKIDDQSS